MPPADLLIILLIVLTVLAVVLAVVTVVGHGIWVLLATIFGRSRRPVLQLTCPFCAHGTPAGRARCDWCGRELGGPAARELTDLRATERQVRSLEQSGALDPAAAQAVLAGVEARRRHWLGGRSSPLSQALEGPGNGGQGPGVRDRRPATPLAASPPKHAVPAAKTPVEPARTPVEAAETAVEAEVVAVGTRPEQAAADRILPKHVGGAGRPAEAVVESHPEQIGWGRLLQFMEERNIRWGELIGGLLIVGSSVALVLSLWDTLQTIRYFPFLIFVAATSAVFGAGFYAERRWKLQSTSHGLLVIGALLAPLSFLAMAALSPDEWTWLRGAMELAALGLFAWLAAMAGRIVAGGDRWRLPLAVVGASAAAPLAVWMVGPGTSLWTFLAVGLLPVACFGAATLSPSPAARRHPLDAAGAAAAFTLLGTGLFALAVALGLIVARTKDLAGSLNAASILLALAAGPALLAAMRVRHGTADDRGVAGWRVAATFVALGAMLLMAAALWMAWPRPWTLAAVGAIHGAALLAAALRWRAAWLLAAHQAMVAVAALLATAAWLIEETLVLAPGDLLQPESLQTFGVVLSGVCLAWGLAWIAVGATAAGRARLDELRPHLDGWMRHALVGVQAVLLTLYLLPALENGLYGWSLTAGLFGPPGDGFDATARLFWAMLAAATVVALWRRWGAAELRSSLVLALSAAWLVAGNFAADASAAHALRWGLAGGFVLVSAGVWGRGTVAAASRTLRARIDLDDTAPRSARRWLIAGAVAPVVALSLAAALCQLVGFSPPQPRAGSLFDRLGPELSYLVPLALVVAGLVGHALRERSAGYAFAAGLVGEMTVALGYALRVILGGGSLGTPQIVAIVQWTTVAAAGWAAVWLAARRVVDVWRESPAGVPAIAVTARHRSARALMNAHLGLGTMGIGLLAGLGAAAIVFLPHRWQGWAAAAGAWPGWFALVGVAAAAAWRRHQLGSALRPNTVGLLGMTAIALAACTLRALLPLWGHGPEWAYRALMLGWAVDAILVAAAGWWVAETRTLPGGQGPPQAILRAAAVWVRAAGLAAVLLGIKAAVFHENWDDLLWAAGAIATASAAGAVMAVWRRQESWALTAGLGVNLAASLVVWHYHRDAGPLDRWWIHLVQANVIATASVALAWLAARRKLYALGELRLGVSPLLAVQTGLGVGGNVVLASLPVGSLVVQPGWLPSGLAALGEPAGFVALALAFAAAAWYVRRVAPNQMMYLVAGLLLCGGVLFACVAPGWIAARATAAEAAAADPPRWVAYHALTTAWAAAAALVLAAGWFGRRLRWNALETEDDGVARRTSTAAASGELVFPGEATQWAVALVGAMAVGMAVLRVDPIGGGPRWSIGAVAAVSVTAGLAAMGFGSATLVFFSGVLVNVAGTVAWVAWGPDLGPDSAMAAASANVACFAGAAIVWFVLRRAWPRAVPDLVLGQLGGRPLPYAHVAAVLAVALATLSGLAAMTDELVGDWLGGSAMPRPTWLDAAALGAAAAAMLVSLWDRSARFGLLGLYVLALCADGLFLRHHAFSPPLLVIWASLCELSAIALLAALCGWGLPRMRPLWERLGIDDRPDRWPTGWFHGAQAGLVALTAALAAWIALDGRFTGMGADEALLSLSGHRQVTPAALMLLGGVILMAWQSAGAVRRRWQYASMAAGVLLSSSLGWAWMDVSPGTPGGEAPWLHRTVTLLLTSSMMTCLAGFGLRRVLPRASDWIEAGRRAAPAFGLAAAGALVLALAQEAWLFDATAGVPMTPAAVGIVGAVAALLAAACVGMALADRPDPFGLGPRGRTLYVYAAEILLGMVVLHIWFAKPRLFHLGIIRQYWMWIVMAVAFAGVGLSEWFRRMRRPVLSEPLGNTALLAPLAPVVGFWLSPQAASVLDPAGRTPLVWFAIAAFYALVATQRRSVALVVLALAAGNVGLWTIWRQVGLGFIQHPQLWLIPPALAALLAESLERRLGKDQRAAIRYVALGVIYVSSMTESWRALGDSWLLPAVTILLALAGVFAGILLRVQSFLYLGFACLLVVIGRLIHFAAFERGQMWVLWTFCIVLGAAILALFALFEKRRNDVLSAVERLRRWEK